jgi:uncharacterized membrane protein (UPF0127 family)
MAILSVTRGQFVRPDGTFTAPFTFEIAASPVQHERGLSQRHSLPLQHGMLFVFQQPSRPGFWMKNTHFDLDIGWFDDDRVLRDIVRLQANDLNLVQPFAPIRLAVELAAGTFKAHNVVRGSKLSVNMGVFSTEVP